MHAWPGCVYAFAMLAKDDGFHGEDADMHAQVLFHHSWTMLVELCNDPVSKTRAIDVVSCVCVCMSVCVCFVFLYHP